MRYLYAVARLDDALTQGESVAVGVIAGEGSEWGSRLRSDRSLLAEWLDEEEAEAAVTAFASLAEQAALEGAGFLEECGGSVYSFLRLTAPAQLEAESAAEALDRLANELGL